MLVVAAALVMPGSPALATDAETQLWLTASATASLGDDTSAQAMISQRFRDHARGGDIALARGQLDRKLSRGVAIGGGLTYLGFAAGHEWRAHQQVVLSSGTIQSRTQLEERFVPGAPRPQLRLRERIQLGLALDPRDRLLLSGELLYIARPQLAAAPTRVDSWRLAATIQRKLSAHWDASAGYMLIYAPRIASNDHIIHAPQLALAYRF